MYLSPTQESIIMWLEKRIKQIGLTPQNFADLMDVNINTVRGWFHRDTIPHKIIEKVEVERLLKILQWDWIDLGRAVGYDIPPGIDELPPQLKELFLWYIQQVPYKKDHVLVWWKASRDALDMMDDDPYNALASGFPFPPQDE